MSDASKDTIPRTIRDLSAALRALSLDIHAHPSSTSRSATGTTR